MIRFVKIWTICVIFCSSSSSQAWTPNPNLGNHPRHVNVGSARIGSSLGLLSTDYDTEAEIIVPHRKSMLEKSGGILYRKSIFTRGELNKINEEVRVDMKKLVEECSSSIAQKRFGTTLSTDSDVFSILKEGSLHRLVEKAVGGPCELSANLPVEVRQYAREGAGMAWHVDDVLYDPPQIEVIWTLENDSDCKTMWKEGSSHNEVMHSVESEPNSAILLLAGGASHCVTHLKYGSRVILKFAYVMKGSTYLRGKHKNQFDNRKTKKGKRSKRR